MKNVLAIFLLLNFTLLQGQHQIALTDTFISTSFLTYIQPIADSLPAEIEQNIESKNSVQHRYVLKVNSMFPYLDSAIQELYRPIYMYSYLDPISKEKKIEIINSNKLKNKAFSELDTLILNFQHKQESSYLSASVEYLNVNDQFLKFKLSHFQYGYVPELQKHITIWPYHMGASIAVSDSIAFNFNDLVYYYKIAEDFSSNDSVVYSFVDYDKENRTINLASQKKESKIYGYKPNTYIDTSFHVSDKLTVLYFGGYWCGPCKAENPKLIKMNELRVKEDFDLKTYLTYQSGKLKESEEYYIENLLPLQIKHIELGKEALIRKLQITTFPTYIILDKNNAILYRSDGSKIEAHTFFAKLLRERNMLLQE
ncbi:TlpA family protein disulfide reductase [Portibacter lacus]|uniref:Thioredoxin-like fold domain-containing protein n=1 Tax=Portibacter lacus TaxID=1099794 RepID=A0AA37WES7_9BACT|nr:thioredoxin-like domain-containing protein [Portibacter lacus]GLR16964.1 hypothetical protein GCM10007940_15790 [Portibacter lacus]